MSLVLDTGASRTVLGLDVLRFFNVTLDFERGQLTLYAVDELPGLDVPGVQPQGLPPALHRLRHIAGAVVLLALLHEPADRVGPRGVVGHALRLTPTGRSPGTSSESG